MEALRCISVLLFSVVVDARYIKSCDISHDLQPSCVGSTHLAAYLKLLLYLAMDPILELPRQERVVVDNEVEGMED